jgi:hypothetical protein
MSSVNNFYVKKNLQVGGNLDVSGAINYTSTTINTTDLYVKDRYMVLNSEHNTITVQNSGFIAIGSGSGLKNDVSSISASEITFGTDHGFIANDFINVTGNTVNKGLFQVLAAPTTKTLTINTVPTGGYASYKVFTPETTLSGVSVVKAKLSIIKTGTDGSYQSMVGDTSAALVAKKILLDGEGISNLNLTAVTNQLIFDGVGGSGTNTTTINVVAEPVANRVYSLKDAGADADFVLTEGAQTLVNKTIDGFSILEVPGGAEKLTIVAGGLTADRLLTLNLGAADRTLVLDGNFSKLGAGNLILTTAGATNITFPNTTDTAVTLNAVQTLTKKTMELFTTDHVAANGVTFAYGINICTPASNVTNILPPGIQGQTVKVLNTASAASGYTTTIERNGATDTIEGDITFVLGGEQHTSLTFVGGAWRINL